MLFPIISCLIAANTPVCEEIAEFDLNRRETCLNGLCYTRDTSYFGGPLVGDWTYTSKPNIPALRYETFSGVSSIGCQWIWHSIRYTVLCP